MYDAHSLDNKNANEIMDSANTLANVIILRNR